MHDFRSTEVSDAETPKRNVIWLLNLSAENASMPGDLSKWKSQQWDNDEIPSKTFSWIFIIKTLISARVSSFINWLDCGNYAHWIQWAEYLTEKKENFIFRKQYHESHNELGTNSIQLLSFCGISCWKIKYLHTFRHKNGGSRLKIQIHHILCGFGMSFKMPTETAWSVIICPRNM